MDENPGKWGSAGHFLHFLCRNQGMYVHIVMYDMIDMIGSNNRERVGNGSRNPEALGSLSAFGGAAE